MNDVCRAFRVTGSQTMGVHSWSRVQETLEKHWSCQLLWRPGVTLSCIARPIKLESTVNTVILASDSCVWFVHVYSSLINLYINTFDEIKLDTRCLNNRLAPHIV